MAEIAPQAVQPLLGETAEQLLSRVADDAQVRIYLEVAKEQF
jgi:hypothetical protein